MSDLTPTPEESRRLSEVLSAVKQCIVSGQTILLPRFVPDGLDSETALHRVGVEPNPFGGTLGMFRYQFEGEEDLLHLIVVRLDGSPLSPPEGQTVAAHVLHPVPPGLVWLKPGTYTQHFYFGHDDLIEP